MEGQPAAVQEALRRALVPRASALARLGLPAAPGTPCGAGELRRAYRAAALLVHPDKCSHPEAKLAFQRLSEAFDELSRPGALQWALQRGSRGGGKGRGKGRTRQPPPGSGDEPYVPPEQGASQEEVDERGQRGGRSWWDLSWAEFESRMQQADAEARRKEAVDAACERGDDMLDAYMNLITEEATRGMYTGFGAAGPSGSSGCGAAPTAPVTPSQRMRRARPPPGVPILDPAPPPFHSAKRRCAASAAAAGAATAANGTTISMRLANGGTLAVEAVASARARAAAALEHLPSDESELED